MPPRIELVDKWTDLNEQLRESDLKQSQLAKQQQQAQAAKTSTSESGDDTTKSAEFKAPIVWRNVVLMSMLHIGALYGLKLLVFDVKWLTLFATYIFYVLGGLGITGGAHRLWSHRSYKGKLPYRIMLGFFNTIAFQNSIYEWSRDHRMHHKYSETDADPHNVNRGLFFAHMGWLMCRKHPEIKAKGSQIDMSDLWADPVVRFQHQNYLPLVALCCFVMPTVLPHYLWGESLFNAFYVCAVLRYVITLHSTWLVNSAAHVFGRRPYDDHIMASENRGVSFGALGEGFHNYHHTFPWDYAASELGYEINLTKFFIDTFAKIGWAYDRKGVSPEIVKQRKVRTGDVAKKGPYGPHNY